MALLRLLKSGNFTVVKVAILGSLKSATFKAPLKWQFYSRKSGNFKES